MENKYTDPTGALAESTMRIKDLHQVERKLVLLIETASEAISILCEEASKDKDTDQFIRERTLAFRDLASKYFSLVNDIQFSLRSHTNYLAKEASMTSSTPNKTIPFKTSIMSEQKELEVWTDAVGTLQQRIAEIKKIATQQQEEQ